MIRRQDGYSVEEDKFIDTLIELIDNHIVHINSEGEQFKSKGYKDAKWQGGKEARILGGWRQGVFDEILTSVVSSSHTKKVDRHEGKHIS